jgi:acetolactate synthase-1/2/3 large subunit
MRRAAGRIRFVPARGEAGAMNMADAYARVSGKLGVCITSTGTAAGNAAGAQAEALTPGSRVLHITSQVDLAYADRDRAAIHDVPRQPEMLRGSRRPFTACGTPTAPIGTLTAAVSAALVGPERAGQPGDPGRRSAQPDHGAEPRSIAPVPCARLRRHGHRQIAEASSQARGPDLAWRRRARRHVAEATELMNRGVGIVTSTNGRGTVSEEESGNARRLQHGAGSAGLLTKVL